MAQGSTFKEARAKYSKPKLAIFGEFNNLTAGGAGSVVEGIGMGMDMSSMRRA